MSELPACPKCTSAYTYQDAEMLICPECSHEWQLGDVTAQDEQIEIKDANGNILADGDSVTVIKDLKIKGSSSVVKVGAKVKSIRLVPDASDGHNIDCKIEGIGAIKLKSEFVKKV
ncbi:MAG: alkylphosphonate utilization protein [Acinetobacter sp.]|jgi:protein PhnA|nr:MAG: alkylphosphonate utilization protein [Acinetobacter sp.]